MQEMDEKAKMMDPISGSLKKKDLLQLQYYCIIGYLINANSKEISEISMAYECHTNMFSSKVIN